MEFTPASSVGLAIASILALIPVQPTSGPDLASAAARRSLSRYFARASLLQVEEDSEYISRVAGCQSEGLEQEQPFRSPFHSHVPLELEAILALLVLSNYEHTQCGNLLKMATRAGQAVTMAKCLSLHRLGVDGDGFSEARRRTWWMTYLCANLCSISRQNIAEPMGNEDDFTTPYPLFDSDRQVWSLYMESLRITMSSIRLAADHRCAVKVQADTSAIYETMEKLDARIVECTKRAENVDLAPLYTDPAAQETLAAYRMRGYTRPGFSTPSVPKHAKIARFYFCGRKLHRNMRRVCLNDCATAARPESSLSPRQQPGSAEGHAYLHVLRDAGDITPTLSSKSERLEEELRNGLRGVISALAGFAESFEAIRGMRDEIESAINVAFQGIVL
ncbi:hypothetical protein PWT90_08537 [Aphanocladium album]|nr:hypothetical protein PWT90_08537 [Aphanocladium album]